MIKKTIINDNVTTQSDVRNDEAKKHVNHSLTKIGLNRHSKNIVPYMNTRLQVYFCEDCKVVFNVYNTTEDKKEKEKHLKDMRHEE